jgi:hypothetical protein
MNADVQETVKALRCCGIHTDDKNCGDCPVCSSDTPCPDLMPRAAALLESLLAQLEAMTQSCAELSEVYNALLDDTKELFAQLAESQHMERAAIRDIQETLYRSTDCTFCEYEYGPCDTADCRVRSKWRDPGEGKEDGK